MLSNPRVYFAMADDGVLPKVFRQTNEKTQVQEFSLAVFAIFLVVVLFFFETFKDLLSYVMFFDSIGMVSTAATIFILRRRADNVKEGIFQISFGKNVIPALFIFIYAVVAVTALWSSPQNVLKALLLFSLGMPIYWLMKKVVVK